VTLRILHQSSSQAVSADTGKEAMQRYNQPPEQVSA